MFILAILIALMTAAIAAEPKYRYEGTFTVKVPPRGDAPDWVYRAWLGLTLQYTSKGTACIDVLSRKPSSDQIGYHYFVPEDEAIMLLEHYNPEAAAWWKAHGYPKNESFCFPDSALLF